jgi:hypothetical protein
VGEIKFLLKFGEKNYLKRLLKGKMYFSNATKFRYYEEKLLIKGQGDILEGGSTMRAQELKIIDNETDDIIMSGFKKSILIHYEPANLLPVYCLFACHDKDCKINSDGLLEVSLSENLKETIREHFPEANAVAIIRNPYKFISDVTKSIGHLCISDLVNYYKLYGHEVEKGIANDMDYIKYLTQDTPPKIQGEKKIYSFNEKYVYRSLLCKDIFFKDEQEYRFILPELKIKEPREFSIISNQDINIDSLDEFLSR